MFPDLKEIPSLPCRPVTSFWLMRCKWKSLCVTFLKALWKRVDKHLWLFALFILSAWSPDLMVEVEQPLFSPEKTCLKNLITGWVERESASIGITAPLYLSWISYSMNSFFQEINKSKNNLKSFSCITHNKLSSLFHSSNLLFFWMVGLFIFWGGKLKINIASFLWNHFVEGQTF